MNPQPSSVIASTVLESLRQDLDDLQKMLDLLAQERKILETNQHEELESLTARKSSLSSILDLRSSQRDQHLAQAGLHCKSAKQWEEALDSFDATPQGPELRKLWQKVEVKLQTCKDAMLTNEKIVASLLQSTRQFISALRGSDNQSQVYDASGRSSTSSISTGLVQV